MIYKFNCQYCNKKLVPIGNLRENGKYGIIDSLNRKYHLKCQKKDNNLEYCNLKQIEGKIEHYCKLCNYKLEHFNYDNNNICSLCDCELYNNDLQLYKIHGNTKICV